MVGNMPVVLGKSCTTSLLITTRNLESKHKRLDTFRLQFTKVCLGLFLNINIFINHAILCLIAYINYFFLERNLKPAWEGHRWAGQKCDSRQITTFGSSFSAPNTNPTKIGILYHPTLGMSEIQGQG